MNRLTWLIVVTLPLAVVTALSWFGVYTFVNAYLIRGLGWTNEDWTVATLFLTCGMFLWYPLCTEISSRLGRRHTVTLSLIGPTVSYTVLVLFPHPWAIHASMALMGSTLAAYLVAWVPFSAEVVRNRPKQAMAMVAWTLNLVSAITLVIGGRIIVTENYRAMFLGIGAVNVVCLAAFHLLARHVERMIQADSTTVDTPLSPSNGLSLRQLSLKDLSEMARSAMPMVILFGICAAPFSFQSTNALFPNLVRDIHRMDENTIATLVGLGRIPTLITLLGLSYFLDRWNTTRWYGIGLLLDGAAIVAIAFAPGPWSAGGGYLVFYFFHGVVWAAALPAISDCVRPQLRDSAFAITLIAELAAIVFVNLAHNRLLAAGVALPNVFTLCGLVTAAASVVLIAHSSRKP